MTVWVVCLREHGARPSGTKCLECEPSDAGCTA